MQDVKFLIVDDLATIRTLVKKVIESKLGSKTIFEAADGAEAKAMLDSKEIDIILSDWEMPNMSGDELLYYVRNHKNPKLKDKPFIMMTSHGGRDFIMTAIQNGVTHYLVKPFTAVELEDRIRKSWNVAVKRTSDRFASLPPHQLMVKVKDKSFPAQVVNLSRTGAAISMEYTDQVKLFGEYQLSLEFEAGPDRQPFVVNPLYGTAVRLEAASGSMNLSDRKCTVALYFGANTIDRKVEAKLIELVRWLSASGPDTISEK